MNEIEIPAMDYSLVARERDKLKIALADAIRRPMGVIPDSADGLLTQEEIEDAERRRAFQVVKRGFAR